ncbi:MAG: pectin acetylesterase-family hydrolase, partial [Phycisphaerae bacterium]
PTDKPYERHFIPMCTDGSTPPKGTTVCPDGQPIIQCTDGTRPVFYFHPGTEDRWIIKIQGGGASCSAGACWSDTDRLDFSSAWSSNGLTNQFRGIFNIPGSHFSSYNLVVMDKCVGDRNNGSNTIPLQPFFGEDGTLMGEGPVYFHGFREVEALLAHLATWDEPNKYTTNSQISILTQSNGSNGLYMYLDRLAAFIRHDPSDGQPGLGLTNADVRGLASAYVRPSVEAENLVNNPSQNIFTWNDYAMPSFDDHIDAPLSTAGPDGADGLWYSALTYFDGKEFRWSRAWGAVLFATELPLSANEITGVATLDESCFDMHGPSGGGRAYRRSLSRQYARTVEPSDHAGFSLAAAIRL